MEHTHRRPASIPSDGTPTGNGEQHLTSNRPPFFPPKRHQANHESMAASPRNHAHDRAASSGPPRQWRPDPSASRKPNPNQIRAAVKKPIRSSRQQLQPQIKASAIGHGQHQPPIDDPEEAIPSSSYASQIDLDKSLGYTKNRDPTWKPTSSFPSKQKLIQQGVAEPNTANRQAASVLSSPASPLTDGSFNHFKATIAHGQPAAEHPIQQPKFSAARQAV
ncbi:hypothetical protein ACLOJK_018841 [Asimina triloba]